MSIEENIKRSAFQSAKEWMRAQGKEHRVAEMSSAETKAFLYVYEVNKARKFALVNLERRIAKMN